MGAPKGHLPYNINGEGGRPKIHTIEFIENEAIAFEDWIKKNQGVFFGEFAFERGYHRQRLSEFSKVSLRFSDAYKLAQQWQENKLLKGGLNKEFDSGFSKFVMQNVCGWAEKQETKISGDAANPLAVMIQEAQGKSKELVDGED